MSGETLNVFQILLNFKIHVYLLMSKQVNVQLIKSLCYLNGGIQYHVHETY